MSGTAALQRGYTLGVLVDREFVLHSYNAVRGSHSPNELAKFVRQHGAAQDHTAVRDCDLDCARMRHSTPQRRAHPLRKDGVADSSAIVGRARDSQSSL